MTMTAAELRAESARLARLARETELEEARNLMLAREARKPKAPLIEDGAPRFITFKRILSGRVYTYAAVGWSYGGKGNARWAITASRIGTRGDGDAGRYTWNGLLEFIGEANWSTIEVVTASEPLLGPDDEPAVVERIGPYGKVERTEHVEDYHGKAAGYRSPFDR